MHAEIWQIFKGSAVDFGSEYELSFANGGDQNNNTIPERTICDQMG